MKYSIKIIFKEWLQFNALDFEYVFNQNKIYFANQKTFVCESSIYVVPLNLNRT